MTILVAVVGVDKFKNNVSQTSVQDIRNYLYNEWHDEVEDGTTDYDAGIYTQDITVPYRALCDDCNDYWDRANDADDWLYYNFGNYSTYDVIVVADYHDTQTLSHRGAAQEIAGTSRNKVAIVDADQIIDDSPQPWDPNPVERIAYHELMHMFMEEPDDEEHDPDVYYSRYQSYGTLMWDSDIANPSCYNGGSPTTISDSISNCTRNTVRNYIDSQL